MKNIALACAIVIASASFAALADADPAAKRAEIRSTADKALAKFYSAQPRVKSEVEAAPGYAVFTNYGLTFLVGGSGGAGLAHDNKTKQDTYMNMAQASAGLEVGAGKREMLIVFKTPKALAGFVQNGWEFGGRGAAAAGAGGKTAGKGEGEQFINDAIIYSYTTKGVELGASMTGTKFWKDKDLN